MSQFFKVFAKLPMTKGVYPYSEKGDGKVPVFRPGDIIEIPLPQSFIRSKLLMAKVTYVDWTNPKYQILIVECDDLFEIERVIPIRGIKIPLGTVHPYNQASRKLLELAQCA